MGDELSQLARNYSKGAAIWASQNGLSPLGGGVFWSAEFSPTYPAFSGENAMPIYKAPVEDVNFLLNDVFQIDRYNNLPGFADASSDVREAILDEAAKLSEKVLQPLNRVGDLEGCKRNDDGSVTTP